MKKVFLGLLMAVFLVGVSAMAGEIPDDVKLHDLDISSGSYFITVTKPIAIKQAEAIKSKRYGVLYVTFFTTGTSDCYIFWIKPPAASGYPYILPVGQYELGRQGKDSTDQTPIIHMKEETAVQKVMCANRDGQSFRYGELKKAFQGSITINEAGSSNGYFSTLNHIGVP